MDVNLKRESTTIAATSKNPRFFNQNQASRYTDPYRNIERLGDNFVTQIMFELRCF